MKKAVALMFLLIVLFVGTSFAGGWPNILDPTSRVPVDSEIDPWDVVKSGSGWGSIDIFDCPDGDMVDIHLIMENKNSEIGKIEIVIGRGPLPYGALLSYSYMDKGKWRMFWYDFGGNRYVEYFGLDGHGGSIFEKLTKK